MIALLRTLIGGHHLHTFPDPLTFAPVTVCDLCGGAR